MKPLILFDLDDTLLKNHMDSFLPVYLNMLSKQLSDIPEEMMVSELMNATKLMIQKDTPSQTLEQTFDQHFYPAVGCCKEELSSRINDFYVNKFADLKYLTKQKPEAINLVKEIQKMGYPVAIATNPLFPFQAVEHRLNWAGLSPYENNFQIITSYETFHFAKPNPAYFLEILAQLGWDFQTAVMIGNDWKEDIQAASRAGLAVFWLTDEKAPFPDEAHSLSKQGTTEEIIPWLRYLEQHGYELNFHLTSSLIALLKSTPAALDSICDNLSDQQWKFQPEKDEWCLTEILCHLRDVDIEVNLPRIDMILKNENVFIPGKSTDNWAKERHYFDQDGKSALSKFIDARIQIIEKLNQINIKDWDRTARHTIFGPTTLKELIGFISTHDRVHIQQVINTKKSLFSSN